MEIELRQHDGAPAAVPAEVRRCTPADWAEVFALQSAVRAAMPYPEQFMPNSGEELLTDLQRSLCIGVWAQGKLAAYSILRYCGESDHNYANYLDVPKCDLKYWANGDTVVVAPEWRGNGLQCRLLELSAQWRRPEIIGIGCTVSPENPYSMQNLEAAGFSVHTRRLMYGEHDRFVMECRLPPLPGYYRHFKGMPYRVLALAKHSETQEPMVVYQALYGARGIWVRPMAMWFEHVDRGEYHGPRFVADETAAADGQTEAAPF